MAATIPSCGVVIEKCQISCWTAKSWDVHSTKPSSIHTDIQHKAFGEPLWIDSWGDPAWVYGELRNSGFSSDSCSSTPYTSSKLGSFTAALRACTRTKDLACGITIHHHLLQNQVIEECSDALVTMYAKCGELGKAKELLDMYKSKDVITWTALIAGYAREGQGQSALEYFEQMQNEGIVPNAVTYACALKACASIKDVGRGKQIHDEIARQGLLQNNMVLGGALVDMYVKCRAVSEARRVLDELPSRNVVSWNALITGYAREGEAEQALDCLEQMQREGILPDPVTYACSLKACATIRAFDKGKQIHQEIARQGLLQNDVILGNALVDMYAKCGDFVEARRVLKKFSSQDVASWNSLIGGYAQEGEAEQAFNCLEQMQHEGILPNAVTYMCVLKACAMVRAVTKGKQIHDEVARRGLLQKNIVLGNALIDMYVKCGDVLRARQVLYKLPSRNVVSWNALISGYAQGGEAEQALSCFDHMQHEGILPNAVTYVCALQACAAIRAFDRGKQIHDAIVRQGLFQNDIVLGNALVDFYVKCGAVLKAQEVLVGLPFRDVVSWSALIAGYAQGGQAEQALNCFQQMQSEGISPDAVTCASLLNVCCHRGLVDEGQTIFVKMSSELGVSPNLECYIGMIDLFGRAGHLEKSVGLIQEMPSSDHMAFWHALLGACQKWADVDVGEWAFERSLALDKTDGSVYVLMASIYTEAGLLEKAKSIEAMTTSGTW